MLFRIPAPLKRGIGSIFYLIQSAVSELCVGKRLRGSVRRSLQVKRSILSAWIDTGMSGGQCSIIFDEVTTPAACAQESYPQAGIR